uniref:protein-serine/threonine phosphatase n=1 Tax=Romanomermis culicivorax TaxID=13658 RepID=A0A915IUD7_ROMCU
FKESHRGISYLFGEDVVYKFCEEFKIDLVCRAHQVVHNGCEFFAKRKLLTIFSAPNYCGEFDNYGGVLMVLDNLNCRIKKLKPANRVRKSATAPSSQSNPASSS